MSRKLKIKNKEEENLRFSKKLETRNQKRKKKKGLKVEKGKTSFSMSLVKKRSAWVEETSPR